MAAQIPPWLDVSPNSFLAATESGERAGESQRATDIGVDQYQQQEQQRAISQAAAIAQENQRLQQIQKAAAVNAQVTQQKNQNDFLIKMQQDNVLNAYRQNQLGLQKDRLAQAAADATTKFAQTQTKESDIRTGAQAKLAATMAGREQTLKVQQARIQQEAVKAQLVDVAKAINTEKAKLIDPNAKDVDREAARAKLLQLQSDRKRLTDQLAQTNVATDAALPPAGNPPPAAKVLTYDPESGTLK